MSKLLYIKANPKSDLDSRTFQISEKFIEAYTNTHPGDEITTLDLYKTGCGFLDNEVVSMHSEAVKASRDHPVFKYAFQFREADKYVIAAPMWNLGIPAILKAYIDYIVAAGVTFKYTDAGAVGLLTGKKAAFIVTRGGEYLIGAGQGYEMGERYLRTIFGFLGVMDFTTIAAEGLDLEDVDVDARLHEAVREAQLLARRFNIAPSPARREPSLTKSR